MSTPLCIVVINTTRGTHAAYAPFPLPGPLHLAHAVRRARFGPLSFSTGSASWAQSVRQGRATPFGYRIDLPLHVKHHPTHTRVQRTQRLLHAFVLLRMGVAANLTRQVRLLAVVVLPQLQVLPRSRLYQIFGTLRS